MRVPACGTVGMRVSASPPPLGEARPLLTKHLCVCGGYVQQSQGQQSQAKQKLQELQGEADKGCVCARARVCARWGGACQHFIKHLAHHYSAVLWVLQKCQSEKNALKHPLRSTQEAPWVSHE